MKIHTLPILLLTIALAAPAPAAVTLDSEDQPVGESVAAENPAKPAIDAFNKGRPFEAVRLAQPLAEAGNPEALLIMAIAHETGQGIDADRDKAIEYYRKSKQAGNQESNYRLARLLVDTGEEDSQKEARKLLEELAKDDTGAASRILGEGSLRGWFGGEPDFEKTRSWWASGAEKGDVTAMLALGRLLDGNFGFPEKRDPAAALEQFVKAASLDNPAAMVAAGSRLLNGDESIRNEKQGRDWLDKAIKKEQFDAYLALGDFEEIVKENKEAALANYRKGADSGQAGCMIKLASFLLEGVGGAEKNADEALGWFKKAGQSGNALGHVQAAKILLQSDQSDKLFEGYSHLIAAAEAGLADVQNEVGLLYLSGRLGIRDATAAAGWFSRASSGGLPQAANNLATLYEQGLGVPRNFGQAGRLYTRAANAGHPQATTALGRFHARGMGTEQDLPKAWALFSLAVERGDNDAKASLGDLTSQLSDDQLTQGRKILTDLKKPNDQKKPEDGGTKVTPKTDPEGATKKKSDKSAE